MRDQAPRALAVLLPLGAELLVHQRLLVFNALQEQARQQHTEQQANPGAKEECGAQGQAEDAQVTRVADVARTVVPVSLTAWISRR